MAGDDFKENDEVTYPDGTHMKVIGGQWVTLPSQPAVPPTPPIDQAKIDQLNKGQTVTGNAEVPTGPTSLLQDASYAAKDVAHTAPAQLLKGVIGLGTMVPDTADLAARGAESFEDKYPSVYSGIKPGAEAVRSAAEPVGYNSVKNWVENNATGPLPEPQTTAGKIVGGGLSLLPAALLGGAGGLISRGLRGFAAGAGSEAAGETMHGVKPNVPFVGPTDLEPYARIGGGILGAMAPGGLRSYITPNPASAERLANAASVRSEGIPLTAGQATGSSSQLAREGAQKGSYAPAYVNDPEVQQRAVTAALLRGMGVQGVDNASDNLVKGGLGAVSKNYKDISAQTNITAPHMAQAVQEGVDNFNKYTRAMGVNKVSPQVRNHLEDAYYKIDRNPTSPTYGQMTGNDYQQLRSSLTQDAAHASDPTTAFHLKNFRDSLDNAMARSVQGTPYEGQWENARQQWGAGKGIQAASQANNAEAASGILDPGNVYANIKDKGNPTARLARAAQSVVQPIPTTNPTPGALTHVLSALVGPALGRYFPGTVTEGPAETSIAGAISVPHMVQLAKQNPATRAATFSRPMQAYYENQMWKPNAGLTLSPGAVTKLLLANPNMKPAVTAPQ